MALSMFEYLITRLITLADKLGQLRSWRRAATAFLFGLLSALAFPPVNLTPILWICFPVLIIQLRSTTTVLQSFIVGWCYAFGFFLLGLYWIAAAMFVDLAQFWWAIPLAVAGLPFFFAFNYGIAAALARRIGLQGTPGVLFFALLWFLADYGRGHLYTGFPWIIAGYAWSNTLPVEQLASCLGVYGLSLVTLVLASMPAILTQRTRGSLICFVGSLAVLTLIWGWGSWRLSQDVGTIVPHVRLRLVQPNIDQASKWNSAERGLHFQHLLDLTSQSGNQPITHAVWPETAATFYLMEDPDHRQDIAHHLPEGGSLMTGVIRREMGEKGRLNYYNSLVAINSRAQVIAGYDKFHLVPFGEYIPFRNILPLRTLANMGLDFSRGEGIRSLRVAGLPSFSPLICYEAIFPGAVVDPEDRPHFLLNITNDGWYGKTAGPYQHFAIVKLRAIEEGIPLIRAANTGISGVVDAYGRIRARLGVGITGFVDADLPQIIAPTPFSLFGEIPLWSLFGLLSLTALFCRLREMKIFHRILRLQP